MPTLDWIGKQHVIAHHLEVPYRVLERRWSFDAAAGRQAAEGGDGSGNMIIRGDNLHALKSLLPRYAGRVKCIYIDPPYNTGNEGWVYNDNVNAPQIKKWLGEVVGKEGEDLSRHDKWLCMMYPRLKLLHKLLAEDGFIFVSLDDNEVAAIKMVLSEIFGENNFVAQIIIEANRRGQTYKQISKTHEYLLCFQKSDMATLHEIGTGGENLEKSDEFGAFSPRELRNRNPKFGRFNRPNLFYPIYINPQAANDRGEHTVSATPVPGYVETVPLNSQGDESCWRWGQPKLEEASCTGTQIIFAAQTRNGDWRIFEKYRKKSVKAKTIWAETEFINEQGTYILGELGLGDQFQFPKPTELIRRCIQLATNPGDLIMDSFAGSGTTAHAVLKQNAEDGGNRRFILVEMEDYAESITAERVQRVIAGYGEGKNAVPGTGGGFSFYELGEPLLLADGNLNEAVGAARIREYVWHMETRQPAMPDCSAVHPHLLGVCNGAAYWFYYVPQQETVLDMAFLATLPLTMPQRAERHIMYADVCALNAEQLERYRIQFKKIPRDIQKL